MVVDRFWLGEQPGDDLVETYRTGASLNDADAHTFYTGGAEGCPTTPPPS